MITYAPDHSPGAITVGDGPQGFLGWLQHALCGLRGHDAVLQYERNRIFLRCTSCGHETPGWNVSAAGESFDRLGSYGSVGRRRELVVARKVA